MTSPKGNTMTNRNLIERLRSTYLDRYWDADAYDLIKEAAALIEQQEALLADLKDALDDMTKHYVELAGSGDCGFWDPEKEMEVIASRGLILAAKTHLDPGSP